MRCSAIVSFLYLAGLAAAIPANPHPDNPTGLAKSHPAKRHQTRSHPTRSHPKKSHPNVKRKKLQRKTTGEGGQGLRAVGYYGNWDIYDRKFFITDIEDEQLTHLIYSFANVNPETGEVYLSDEHADLNYYYPGDKPSNSSEPQLYGNLKQLYLLKKKNRHLKTLLAILGYTYSPNMVPVLASAELRANFVSSAVKLVTDLGLDGLDIDYEYVTSTTEAVNMVTLLKDLRAALDKIPTNSTTSPFLLTAASPAGPAKYKLLDLPGMDKYLSFWNFMGYDYSGSWDKITAHSSNVFPDPNSNITTPFSSNNALKWYVESGVAPQRINLGMPLYGRGFANTKGIGQPFNNSGATTGSYDEANVWDYKDLTINGVETNVPEIGASYSYDATKKYLISFDNKQNAEFKATYVVKYRLGGAMWWEVSQDKQNDDSLIRAVVKSFGGRPSLENSLNHLDYPHSKYENLRKGFPGIGLATS
ncbi:hypothetical protein PZA11_001805 [Diplocarpon coronariae]|uniref:chitinase n=1 Tax=Diplocarpon coronariae TaxID=2795749 RepID=A0A218ZCN4_9HELO|nr:class V chitinase ChiB [Marssonina coronariae]